MNLDKKHIVITGGASGLGLEFVRQLHGQNRITVISRASGGLEDLRAQYPDIQIIEADLSDLVSVDTAATHLVSSGEKIDILINNAAVQHTPYFVDEEFDPSTIVQEVTVNFTSVCTLIYRLLPSLTHDQPATILNINSGLGLVPKTSSAVYCATKGALNIFSQSLNYQLAKTNISVRQVFLPLVDTPMTEGRGKGKMSPDAVVTSVIKQLKGGEGDIYIGKARFLPGINRFAPQLARKIMKAA